MDEGHPPSKNATTGNIVAAITIFLYVTSIFLLLMAIIPDFADSMEDFVEDIFGRKSGKAVGQLVALLGIALVFPLLKFTIGSEKNFKKTISRYEQLEGEEKTMAAFKGLMFFIGSVALIFVAILVNVVISFL